jgi:hypothetical protein
VGKSENLITLDDQVRRYEQGKFMMPSHGARFGPKRAMSKRILRALKGLWEIENHYFSFLSL